MLVVQLEETINAFDNKIFSDIYITQIFNVIKLRCRRDVKNVGGQYYVTGNSNSS